MKIYLASVNLGDKPNPRTYSNRLLSFYEINLDVFGAGQVWDKLILYNKGIKNETTRTAGCVGNCETRTLE